MLKAQSYSFKRLFLILIALLVLSGCGDQCVDASDWGDPKVTIHSAEDDLIIRGTCEQGSRENCSKQWAYPKDTGLELVDAKNVPLLASVVGGRGWTSWLGEEDAGAARSIPISHECRYRAIEDPKDASVFYPEVVSFAKDQGCPSPPYGPGVEFNPHPENGAPANCALPCWLKDGMGLYIGLAPEGGNHNNVLATKHIPDSKLGQTPPSCRAVDTSYWSDTGLKAPYEVLYDRDLAEDKEVNKFYNMCRQGKDGYLLNGLPVDEIPGSYTGDRIFMKIVDRYYGDNYGDVTVRFQRGVREPGMGPIEKLATSFIDPIKAIMERVYKGIVSNTTFIFIVQSFMVLSIIFYGYAFMIGMIESPIKDFMIRVIKFSIVVVLISPSSWEFFYTYLFDVLIHGAGDVAALVVDPFNSYGDSSNIWYTLDSMLKRLYSGESFAKIHSLLFSNALGFLYIFIIYLALLQFFIILAKSIVIAITTFLAFGFLIIVAPFFIAAILFKETYRLFEEWVNQLIAFGIQLVVLFAALGLFVTIIMRIFEQTIGFTVCTESLFSLNLFGLDLFDIRVWAPDISNLRADVVGDWGNGVMEYFSNAYPSATPDLLPFVDLPYLDPIFEGEKIDRYQSESDFITFTDVLLLAGMTFLMNHLLSFVPLLSDSLKGGGHRQGSASLFTTGGGSQSHTLNTALSGAFEDATIGSPGKSGYATVGGRDMGILGGVSRASLSVGKSLGVNAPDTLKGAGNKYVIQPLVRVFRKLFKKDDSNKEKNKAQKKRSIEAAFQDTLNFSHDEGVQKYVLGKGNSQVLRGLGFSHNTMAFLTRMKSTAAQYLMTQEEYNNFLKGKLIKQHEGVKLSLRGLVNELKGVDERRSYLETDMSDMQAEIKRKKEEARRLYQMQLKTDKEKAQLAEIEAERDALIQKTTEMEQELAQLDRLEQEEKELKAQLADISAHYNSLNDQHTYVGGSPEEKQKAQDQVNGLEAEMAYFDGMDASEVKDVIYKAEEVARNPGANTEDRVRAIAIITRVKQAEKKASGSDKPPPSNVGRK